MAVDLPEGFVLDAPQSSGLPDGFVVDSPQSFTGNVSDSLSKRWQNMQDIGNQARAGQLSLPRSALRMAGQETGALGDLIGESVSSLAKGAYDNFTTQGMKDNLSDNVNKIANSSLGQMASGAVKSGVGAWNQYESQNPGSAQDIKDAANIGSGVLGAKGLEGLVTGAGNMAGAYGDMQANALNEASKGAAPALSELGSVPDVSGNPVSNFFAKNPNPLKVGMETHDSINQAYDAAKSDLSQSATAARTIAPAVDATPILDKLDKLTGSLSGKTAYGEGEEGALSTLNDIKANLASKAGAVASTAGETPSPSLSASDLMDVESSLNAALKGKPTAGSRHLIDFKNTVQDELANAGESNPEFGSAYDDYKNKAISLAKNFNNNPSLKSIWQPNDYIAWKAYQNNLSAARDANPILKNMPDSAVATQINSTLPADQRINPYSPAALSRIGNVAKNLGKGDLGTISSITKILPDDSNSLLRQALLIDKQKKISLGSALGKLAQGSLQQALQTATSSLMTGGKASPLELTVKNLKNLKN